MKSLEFKKETFFFDLTATKRYSLNIIFMGTPDFAIPSLTLLLASDNTLAGVITQPDRPRGRGKQLQPPPVKGLAQQHGIPIIQPGKVKDDDCMKWLKAQHPDLIVVVAFGQILPPRILRLPSHGCINLHASLLPNYRGAAPINWTIMNGDTKTGVTTMFMNEWMDTGDILLQRETAIEPDEDAPALRNRLATLGAKLLLETIHRLKRGELTALPQDHSKASYAPPLKKEDGRIDWQRSAQEIQNQIRGTLPWPGAFTRVGNKLFKIFKSELGRSTTKEPPGTVTDVSTCGITVITGNGHLLITEVQLQDRKRMAVAEFVKGNPITTGTQLG
jgi:methionyl-tRNA formyltransferase